MKESHGEGVASHTGPSHAPVPARAGAKRWFWGTCRPGIEPRNRTQTGVPTRSRMSEGHIGHAAIARRVSDSAWSETPCMHGSTSHGIREIPCSTLDRRAQGPRRES